MLKNMFNPVQFYEFGKSKCTLIGVVVDTNDADSLAFITETGITDATQKDSVFYIVSALKQNGIWSKLKAIYPLVGGTAVAHKYNLKDPRDLDVAFRLQFNGTITHDSGGMKGNGTTGYANTFFIPSSNLTVNNGHWSFYSRTNVDENNYELGSTSTGAFNSLLTRFNNLFYAAYTNSYLDTVSVSDSLGFYVVNRISTNTVEGYKNGSRLINNSKIGYLSTSAFYILAENNNGKTLNYSNKQCAFASFGDGLTGLESCRLYRIIQQFQTILSRQV